LKFKISTFGFLHLLAILIIFTGIVFSPAESGELPPPPPQAIIDPDTRTDRLCAEAAAPDAAPDKILINCKLEFGAFAPEHADATVPQEITVVAYNLERGMKLNNQIEMLISDKVFGMPDIMLVSESDRGCSRTDYKNVTRDLAKALGMNYVYGVEFMELPRKARLATDVNETLCEHGNAVLSKYPIVGADQIRHKYTQNWYIPPGPERNNQEPRLGGCMAVAADIRLPGGLLRVYSSHLDSGFDKGDDMRASEANEIVSHADGVNGPVIVGGDMNTILYMYDIQNNGRRDSTSQIFFGAGFKDAHESIPYKKRGTTIREYGVRAVIDLIMTRNIETVDAGICPTKVCDTLSDHLPVWAKFRLK